MKTTALKKSEEKKNTIVANFLTCRNCGEQCHFTDNFVHCQASGCNFSVSAATSETRAWRRVVPELYSGKGVWPRTPRKKGVDQSIPGQTEMFSPEELTQ